MTSTSWLEDRVEELKAAIGFGTRLPLPYTTPSGSAVARAAWALPLAGLFVGIAGAAIYAISRRLGLPPWPASALAVAATLLVTGALHEDGLADTADGFGGGTLREQKLAIMRDSRIGAYGVCALTLALILRVAALASFANGHFAVWALIASHVGARAALPFLMLLPPARSDGLSHDAGRPGGEALAGAAAIGFVIVAFCLYPGRAIVALIALAAVTGVMAWLTSRQIEGQTGDVLGALEQVGEIAVLLVALA
jgi:adenosylcobinamide-GDP ribazoletransferase